MAEQIAVEVLKKQYSGDMTKLEHEFETGKGLIDTRYGEKRTMAHLGSYETLKEGGKHLLHAGKDAGLAILKPIVGTVGAVILVGYSALAGGYHVLHAGYETLLAGRDTLESGYGATKASVTTRVDALSEKWDLGAQHKADKVKTTLNYAGIAQRGIDGLDEELAPFEEKEAALRAELARVAAEKAPIMDTKFNVVAERKTLENKAKKLNAWYNI